MLTTARVANISTGREYRAKQLDMPHVKTLVRVQLGMDQCVENYA